MDIPARDLAILFRSRNPLVICETVEEKRLEALVRAVASELRSPVAGTTRTLVLVGPMRQPKPDLDDLGPPPGGGDERGAGYGRPDAEPGLRRATSDDPFRR